MNETNDLKWFAVVGYAVRQYDGKIDIAHFNGYMDGENTDDVQTKMLKITKEKFPESNGYTGHYVIVVEHPDFTIRRQEPTE